MATRKTATSIPQAATEVNRARMALYQQLMNVPHRKIEPIVTGLREAMTVDPDFTARACVYLLAGGTKIRDQQDAAVITLLQAPPQFQEYRQAGRALLLGSNVYNISVGTPAKHIKVKSIPAFRVMRTLDYITQSDMKIPRLRKTITRDFVNYVQSNENVFHAIVTNNRPALIELFVREHIRPNKLAKTVLFNNEPIEDTTSWWVRKIANEPDVKLKAQWIAEQRIPYRIAVSIAPKTHPIVAMALIEVMTPTEAANSRAWIEKSGLLKNDEVKKVYLQKVGRASNVASIAHRASSQGADEEVQAVMEMAQEKAVKSGDRIKSDLLLLIDRSGSLSQSIDVAVEFGARIAPVCDGQLRVVVFNDYASIVTVTDPTSLKGWKNAFKGITANGGTSIAKGFMKGIEGGFHPQAICIISDGAEHIGSFTDVLDEYCNLSGMTPIVQMIRVAGEPDTVSRSIEEKRRWTYEKFEFTGDYNLFDQATAFLGGPTPKSIVERIMDTEIPYIVGVR